MAVVYIMCGTTNKNRREQDNRTDGVENNPCFTEATLFDRVLDNPPVTKSHNQRKRIQNRTSQKPPRETKFRNQERAKYTQLHRFESRRDNLQFATFTTIQKAKRMKIKRRGRRN